MSNINIGSESKNWRSQNPNQSNVNAFEIQEEEFPCILPASPNWYCNTIISCLNGSCAFGGKNAIFIFDLKTKPPVCNWSHAALAFTVKITSVVLMCVNGAENGVDFVAFGTEDGLLKILNIETKSLYKDIRKHKEKVVAVCWSPLMSKTLVSGDEKGCVLVWNFEEKICNVWTPLPSTLSCVSLSPHVMSCVLLGYTNGNIIVGDTQKMEVLHNLKSHSHEICSFSWKPLTGSEKETLFVSGSKDRTLRVWNCIEGNQIVSYTLPKNINNNNKQQVMKTKIFNSVLWLNDSQILSGYHSGEILAWDTSNGKWNVVSNGHQRLVFAICRDSLTDYFVSVSMDRQLIFHKSSSLSTAYKIPTFGGFVYSASITSNNPNKLALGIGDNTIRVWTTGVDVNPYESSTIWQGIKTKVTVLLYHPIKEGIIGFGTEDGHAGCFSSITQKSDVSVTYHKKTVYALSWGPCCGNEEQEEKDLRVNCLFSVGGEGTVYMHKMGAFSKNALDVSSFIKETNKLSPVPLRSDIAWHSGLEYVAIGNEDGSTDIFKSRKLILVCKVQIYKKMINTLAWHHDFQTDEKESRYLFWLACGSNEEAVCVVDLKSLTSLKEDVLIIDQPHQSLVGHCGRITKVSWCPYKSGVLASSSYDGSVQIWDVNKNEGLANYRGHIGRVHCVTWSYNNPEVLFSGGEDFCLHRWKYTELTEKMPPTSKKTKSKSKKKKKDVQSLEHTPERTEKVIFENVVSPVPSESKQEALQKTEPVECVQTTASTSDIQFVDKSQLTKKKKRTKTSILKKSSVADRKKKELLQEDCVNLASYLHGIQEVNGNNIHDGKCTTNEKRTDIHPGSEEFINLGFYSTRKDLLKMISTECSGHIEQESYESAIQLELWRNNIGGAIDIATQNNALTETLVALSPLGGHDLWRATILNYAEQLEGQKQLNLAATYYAAGGDVYRAVNMLKSHDMLKEALVLSKAQLDNKDPILKELYLTWAKKLDDGFSYENAAECYLACGYIEEAIAMLSKRNDSNAILTAMKVSDIYGFEKKSSELLSRAISALLLENKWKTCHDVMKKLETVQICHLKAIVGELLLEYLSNNDSDSTMLLLNNGNLTEHRYFGEQKIDYPTYVQLQLSHEKIPFLFAVLSILESKYNITPSTMLQFSHLIGIAQNTQKQQATSHSPKVLQDVISHTLCGIVYFLQGNLNFCFKAWLVGCNLLTVCGCQFMLEPFHHVLFPRGKISFEVISNFHDVEKHGDVSQQLFTNFMAYSFHGELYRKWWTYSEQQHLRSTEGPNAIAEASGENKNSVKEEERVNTNLHSFINYTSSVLLHGSYALCFQLKERIERVDATLLELDIKKRLREHIQTKQQQKAQINKTMNVDQVVGVVNSLLDNVIEDEEKTKHDALLQRKNDLLASWNNLPDVIKEYDYPHSKYSLPVFLLLCCLSRDTNGPMKKRCTELVEWGKLFDVYEPHKYIETILQRFCST